jgi:hypothetical protein
MDNRLDKRTSWMSGSRLTARRSVLDTKPSPKWEPEGSGFVGLAVWDHWGKMQKAYCAEVRATIGEALADAELLAAECDRVLKRTV